MRPRRWGRGCGQTDFRKPLTTRDWPGWPGGASSDHISRAGVAEHDAFPRAEEIRGGESSARAWNPWFLCRTYNRYVVRVHRGRASSAWQARLQFWNGNPRGMNPSCFEGKYSARLRRALHFLKEISAASTLHFLNENMVRHAAAPFIFSLKKVIDPLVFEWKSMI